MRAKASAYSHRHWAGVELQQTPLMRPAAGAGGMSRGGEVERRASCSEGHCWLPLQGSGSSELGLSRVAVNYNNIINNNLKVNIHMLRHNYRLSQEILNLDRFGHIKSSFSVLQRQ